MTWLFIGLYIGLAVAFTVGGYLIRRRTAVRQLDELEGQIPGWVNQAGPPKVIRLQDLVDAINFDLWEDELEGVGE